MQAAISTCIAVNIRRSASVTNGFSELFYIIMLITWPHHTTCKLFTASTNQHGVAYKIVNKIHFLLSPMVGYLLWLISM